MLYSWTPGGCYHHGSNCRNKAAGHNDNAKFTNCLGGSVRNVCGVSPPQEKPTWQMGSVSKRQINKINLPLNSFANTFPQHHSTMSYIIAKDNSGASKHYFRSDDIACLSNVHPTAGPSIYLPNMQSITSTYTGMLPVPMLTSKARTTHILPQLHSASLISL